jgi:hypothetical protein
MNRPQLLFCVGVAAWPAAAVGHSFGQVYNLPVPFWLYAYGAAAALLVSFVVVGYFATAPAAAHAPVLAATEAVPKKPARLAPRLLSVAVLLLTIATGLAGSPDPYKNFNMTFFWVVFVLGGTYATALVGDFYARVNPWRALVEGLERLRGSVFAGRIARPESLGVCPALILYFAFIAIELFAHVHPRSLSLCLLAYTAINFAGAWLMGTQAWFANGEFFGPYFRFIGRMAPLHRDVAGKLRLRPPFTGLLATPATSLGELLFVLFMLSSTAFDGIHETAPWVHFFWRDLFNAVLQPALGGGIAQSFVLLQKLYLGYQLLALALSPLLYFALYALCVELARRLGRSELPLRTLLLRFAFTLVPIAFVYNLAHYVTLLVGQGAQILRLAADPFGWGWNESLRWIWNPAIDAGVVWHAQVAMILGGHIVSVWLAHLEALALFGDRRRALASQLPMLLLMVALTTLGLWILSLPLQTGSLV